MGVETRDIAFKKTSIIIKVDVKESVSRSTKRIPLWRGKGEENRR